MLFKYGLSDISLDKYCLIKCNFLAVPERKVLTVLKNIFPQIKKFENGLKKVPDLKILALILGENPLFFPDFPDWKSLQNFP